MTAKAIKPSELDHVSKREPNFTELLQEVADKGEDVSNWKMDPGGAFRRLFDAWVEQGGYVKGKQRNSARQIKEWLGEEDKVRSLETKLAGKTMVPCRDTRRLLALFFKYWKYNPINDQYSPYASNDHQTLVEHLLKELHPTPESKLHLPDRGRANSAQRNVQLSSEPNLTFNYREKLSHEVILETFKESCALIMIDRARSPLQPDPAQSIIEFRDMMSDLHRIDQQDDRKRALIWVFDLSSASYEICFESTFLNMEFLTNFFRVISFHDLHKNAELIQWLMDNVLVVVGGLEEKELSLFATYSDVVSSERSPYLPKLNTNHLVIKTPAEPWKNIEGFSDFAGTKEKNFWDFPSVSAHVAYKKWYFQKRPKPNKRAQIRFFCHSSQPCSDGSHSNSRCLELDQPNESWSDSFFTLSQIAFWRLGWFGDAASSTILKAHNRLRKRGFGVFRLCEFLNLNQKLLKIQFENMMRRNNTC